MWMSICSRIICWKESLWRNVLSLLLCQRSLDYMWIYLWNLLSPRIYLFILLPILDRLYCCCSISKSRVTLSPMDCSMPGFPVLHYLPEFIEPMSTESVMPPNHLIFCCPLCLLSSIFLSISVFSNESALCIRWSKDWSFSFSISSSSEYSGLISFRIDWLDLLAVQGTLKSLLQSHNSKSLGLSSAFFMIQLSHLYMTARKTMALDIWIFVGKMMT